MLVRVPIGLAEQLTEKASSRGTSVSEYAAAILSDALDKGSVA